MPHFDDTSPLARTIRDPPPCTYRVQQIARWEGHLWRLAKSPPLSLPGRLALSSKIQQVRKRPLSPPLLLLGKPR